MINLDSLYSFSICSPPTVYSFKLAKTYFYDPTACGKEHPSLICFDNMRCSSYSLRRTRFLCWRHFVLDVDYPICCL